MKRPDLGDLAETEFDLIVIGGGITGTATARDAALRGLSVLLVEKNDFAAGTSSRSSKLVHGGLRYLQTYQFKLVAESVREREKLLKLAPHLTEVRPFLYLLYDGYPESKALLNLGLTFYDIASGSWRQRRHTMLDAGQVLEREPRVRSVGLLGAGLYYDVLTDDARLTLDTAKSAAEAGATLVNHAAVIGLVLQSGRCRGVSVMDTQGSATIEIRARQVVSAVGPWTDEVRALEHGRTDQRMRPTKGVHIVLRKRDFPLDTAVFLRSPRDNRVVWPTPSLEDDRVYIGTTDTDYDGDLDQVYPSDDDIGYLLEVANHTIPGAGLTPRHVVGSWAGLRPLVAPPAGVSTSDTSREHSITTGETGMITISGGKLTSSRLMAKQLVDAALRAMGRKPSRRSPAATTPLTGALGTSATRSSGRAAGVPDEILTSWIRRYGANARRLVLLWRDDERNREILASRGLTRAEIVHAVTHEMARSLDDLLVRRTALFFWDELGGTGEIEAVADQLAGLLGWSQEDRARQIAGYRALVAAHRPRR